MPLIPEAIMAMLATVRIGEHSIFSNSIQNLINSTEITINTFELITFSFDVSFKVPSIRSFSAVSILCSDKINEFRNWKTVLTSILCHSIWISLYFLRHSDKVQLKSVQLLVPHPLNFSHGTWLTSIQQCEFDIFCVYDILSNLVDFFFIWIIFKAKDFNQSTKNNFVVQ